MFGTDTSIEFLSHSPDWFMNGTFVTVPPQFMQLYTIHGLQNGRNAIGLYALLRNKDQATYEHMLNHVSALTNRTVPQSINIDYERAAEIVYPNSNKRGCFFHLSQNVYRHFQQNGLLYLRDQDFRTNIRMVSALAFVPREDIAARFEDLSQHCSPQEIPILGYFETNYVGELRQGLHRPPLFAHSLWNVHDRILLNLPRTTNAVEGWHNAFATSLGPITCQYVEIYRCFEKGTCHGAHVHFSTPGWFTTTTPPPPPPKEKIY